jgi:hypothetical protein
MGQSLLTHGRIVKFPEDPAGYDCSSYESPRRRTSFAWEICIDLLEPSYLNCAEKYAHIREM